MTGDEVVIRPYEPGDERAINAAFNEVFGARRELDEWLWKFPWRPEGRTIMLAWRGGELLAQYAGQPVRFQVDGVEWKALHGVDDFSTRAGRRGLARRGVYVRTAEAYFDRHLWNGPHQLIVGFPGRRHLKLGILQMGYGAVPPQEIRVLAREEGAGMGRGRRLPYRAEPARDWEPRLDTLWERVRGDYPVALVRDARRALERLAGRPRVRYHRYLLLPRFSDEPVGFVAFRTDDGICRWLDLLWDHAHPGALELAAHLSKRLARDHGAPREEMWLTGDPAAREILHRLGFHEEPEPSGLVFLVIPFDESFDGGRVVDRVYLTMADADLV